MNERTNGAEIWRSFGVEGTERERHTHYPVPCRFKVNKNRWEGRGELTCFYIRPHQGSGGHMGIIDVPM